MMSLVPLKRVCSVSSEYGLGVSAHSYADAGVQLLRTTDIDSGGRLRTDLSAVFVPSEMVGDLLLQHGDLLFSRSGTLGRPYLHRAGADPPMTFAAYLVRFRAGPAALPEYLHYCAVASPFQDQVMADAVVSTIANFNAERYGQVRIPLRSTTEQQAIVSFLDAETAHIDAVNAKRRDQLDLLSERQTVIINSLVQGAIQTGAHGVPIGHAGTPSARLGNLAHVQGGLTLDGGRDLGSDTIELPYLRVANVQDGRVDLAEVKTVRVPRALAARCSLAPGDVLMTEGGDPDKLGRGTVWAGLISRCLHQNHVFAVRPDQTRLDPAYLALMTRTQYARVYFEMTAAKTTGIASTSATKITAFRVPLVDLEAQRSQVADVDRRLAEVDAIILPVTRQIALMKERRQALITAAVRGEIDVSTASGRGVPA